MKLFRFYRNQQKCGKNYTRMRARSSLPAAIYSEISRRAFSANSAKQQSHH